MAKRAPKTHTYPRIETRKFRFVGISYWAKRPTHTRISAWAVSAIKNWAKRPTHIHGFHQNDDFRWPPLGPTYVFPMKIRAEWPPKTHTRIEQVILNVKTRLKWPPLQCFRHVQKPRNLRWKIGHKHTHGLHTNTHTDCTKHTHGLHTNTHILLPIVISTIKTWTKHTHTHIPGAKIIFFGWGLPQQ